MNQDDTQDDTEEHEAFMSRLEADAAQYEAWLARVLEEDEEQLKAFYKANPPRLVKG